MLYDYEKFKTAVFQLTKIDLNAYKERQMKRRIDSLISKNGFKGYEDYVQALKTDREKFEEFVTYLTINVSEFYRNTGSRRQPPPATPESFPVIFPSGKFWWSLSSSVTIRVMSCSSN